MDAATSPAPSDAIDAFMARWQGQEGGQERANYALFPTELCDVLGLPHPDVAKATHAHNDYVFERAVQRHLADGDSAGRIDLYKRNSFVLEAKQSRWKGGKKEIAGRTIYFPPKAKQRTVAAPAHVEPGTSSCSTPNGRPRNTRGPCRLRTAGPRFILVCDVGHCIEVYADFTGQGKNYTQGPELPHLSRRPAQAGGPGTP
jgi:hypothetical protein